MRKVKLPLALLAAMLLFLMAPRGLFAWIESGHREVALIAWDDLTPAARTKAIEILMQHPRYREDLLAHEPADDTPEDVPRFAFTSAAIWPDVVKLFSNPMHVAYSHPAWHYINLPYAINGQPVPPETRPSYPTRGPQNVIEALTKNVADLQDANVSPADKAIALCWVLHLLGDIHQPLHAITLYSRQFPNGDSGGNNFIVLRDPPYTDSEKKLHLVWDEMPGEFMSVQFDEYVALGLKSDPRYSRTQLKAALAVKDFTAWAHESYDLGVKYAYLDGKLVGNVLATTRQMITTGATTRDTRPAVPGLPPGYLLQAERVAAERIVLAGYRGADLLNSIFDPASNAAAPAQ